jgi:hypothetical protein
MTDILKKLRDEALVQIYRECGKVAEKYKLDTPFSIEGYETADLLRRATFDGNIGYLDLKSSSTNWAYVGWNDGAPQAICGYADEFDIKANEMVFNIHATRFKLYSSAVLRLWKGCYLGAAGGEIGFYEISRPITNDEMKNKVAETTAEFLRLIRPDITSEEVRREVEKIMRSTPEELRELLVRMALHWYMGIVDSKERQVITRIFDVLRFWLLVTTPVFMPNAILLLVSVVTVARIILIKRLINFIVGIIKIIDEMKNNSKEFSREWGPSLSNQGLYINLGLTGMAVQVFQKRGDRLIAERREYDSGYWATAFGYNKRGIDELIFNRGEIKNRIYTVNHFYFKDEVYAARFFDSVKKGVGQAKDYEGNKSGGIPEEISFDTSNNIVVIYYGK